MSDAPGSRGDVAQDLRRAFDRAFAEPEPASLGRDVVERFLAIAMAEGRYAIGLRDVAALATVRRITPLPGAQQGLLGLTGHRGALVPVFDLAVLLGHAAGASARWVVLCGARELVGLAFATLDGQIDVAPGDIRPLDASLARRHLQAVVPGTPARAIVDVASILGEITKREP